MFIVLSDQRNANQHDPEIQPIIKADIHNPKNEQLLTECVDSFLKYLNNQKVQAIFDKSSVEIQFRSSAEALKNMIDSKGEE